MIEALKDENEGIALLDEEAFTQAQEEAYAAVYQWNGRELYPYSMSREDVVTAFTAKDFGGQHFAARNNFLELRPWASALLFACSHNDEEILALRATNKTHATIVEWAEQNITRHNWEDAVRLALKIHNAIYEFKAVPKPSDKPASGN